MLFFSCVTASGQHSFHWEVFASCTSVSPALPLLFGSLPPSSFSVLSRFPEACSVRWGGSFSTGACECHSVFSPSFFSPAFVWQWPFQTGPNMEKALADVSRRGLLVVRQSGQVPLRLLSRSCLLHRLFQTGFVGHSWKLRTPGILYAKDRNRSVKMMHKVSVSLLCGLASTKTTLTLLCRGGDQKMPESRDLTENEILRRLFWNSSSV